MAFSGIQDENLPLEPSRGVPPHAEHGAYNFEILGWAPVRWEVWFW